MLRQVEFRYNIRQEEAHNSFSDEFTSEVSIHILLVVQYWTQRGRFFFYGRQLFQVTAKVSTYLGMVATYASSSTNFISHGTLQA